MPALHGAALRRPCARHGTPMCTEVAACRGVAAPTSRSLPHRPLHWTAHQAYHSYSGHFKEADTFMSIYEDILYEHGVDLVSWRRPCIAVCVFPLS